MRSAPTLYWIVVAGLKKAGKTTFIQHAAERMTLRDRDDLSYITPEEHQRVLAWLANVGSALDPDRAYQTEEELLFERWARRISVGEIDVDPALRVCLYEANTRDLDFLSRQIPQDSYLGTIMLIDSTDHNSIRDVSRLAAALATYTPDPYLFAASKQDLPNALDPEDIRILIQFLDGHLQPVIPCNAQDPNTVRTVLLRFLELMRESFDDGIQWGNGS